jgi:hypothetical protein
MRGKFRYELLLIFDWFKKVPIKEMSRRMGKDYNIKTLYRYKSVHYPKALRKANELAVKLRK